MFVNYVREINAFNRYANINCLSSGERLLWFGLMDYINLTYASGAEWPGDFIGVPNKSLLSHVPYGEDALIDARNRLKQRGLLEFIPGKKSKEAPKYKIRYFAASQLSTGYQQDCTFYPEKTGNMPGNIGGNMPGNIGGNVPGNMPGKPTNINLNVYSNVNPNVNPNVYEDDDAVAEERARANAREVVDSAFRQHFGRSATVAEANRLALIFVDLGMETGVLTEAIHTAAENGAKNPALYVCRLLNEWSSEYIRTVADLDDYRVMYDMHFGRGPFLADTVSFGEMLEARERRKAANDEAKGGL